MKSRSSSCQGVEDVQTITQCNKNNLFMHLSWLLSSSLCGKFGVSFSLLESSFSLAYHTSSVNISSDAVKDDSILNIFCALPRNSILQYYIPLYLQCWKLRRNKKAGIKSINCGYYPTKNQCSEMVRIFPLGFCDKYLTVYHLICARKRSKRCRNTDMQLFKTGNLNNCITVQIISNI